MLFILPTYLDNKYSINFYMHHNIGNELLILKINFSNYINVILFKM